MAITVEATGNAATTASRSPAITFSSYIPITNDVVVFFPATTTAAALATVASGWVLPTPASGANPVASDSHTQSFTYHLVTAAEAVAITVTFTATNHWNATQTGNVCGLVLRGVDPANVIDSLVSTFDSTNTITPHVLPALTGSNLDNRSLVVRGVVSDLTNTYTTPAAHTARGSSNSTQGQALYTLDALTVAGADVAATNITPTGADEYCSFSAAFTDAKTRNPVLAAIGTRLVGGSVSLVPVPKPAGTALNSVVIVYLESADATPTYTPPAGFTEAGSSPVTSSVASGPSTNRTTMYWKRCTGADGAGTYDFTPNSTVYIAGWAERFEGCVTSGNPFDATNSGGISVASDNFANTSLSTSGPDRLLIWFDGDWNGSTTTVPSGFTKDCQGNTVGGDAGMAIATLVQAAAGPTGTLTGSLPGGAAQQAKCAWLAALKPPDRQAPNRQLTVAVTRAGFH